MVFQYLLVCFICTRKKMDLAYRISYKTYGIYRLPLRAKWSMALVMVLAFGAVCFAMIWRRLLCSQMGRHWSVTRKVAIDSVRSSTSRRSPSVCQSASDDVVSHQPCLVGVFHPPDTVVWTKLPRCFIPVARWFRRTITNLCWCSCSKRRLWAKLGQSHLETQTKRMRVAAPGGTKQAEARLPLSLASYACLDPRVVWFLSN